MRKTLLEMPTPLWTATELAEAAGGRWVNEPSSSWQPNGITYMRRLQFLRPGDIFVTMDTNTRRRRELKRPRLKNDWDTVNELPTFVAAGISAIIAQRDVPPVNLPVLRVPDSGLAVLDLARAARERFKGHAIAITGTVGKSTTKEMLRHVLSRQGPTYATMANYNTYFGVPLCLAQTPRDSHFAIYENAITSLYQNPGPISAMVRPHVAIFTAVGRGLEPYVESMEDIADYKSLIFKGLEPGGVAVVNRDMALFERVRDRAVEYGASSIVTFGDNPHADVRLLEADLQAEYSSVIASIHSERIQYEVPLPGRPMIVNSLAVLAAVHAVGADWRRAAKDMATYETSEGRLRRFRVPVGSSDFELIDDSFNAEQASMIANFEVLSLARPRAGGRRIAVLGQIGGLTDPEQTHAELAAPLMSYGVDKVYTYGDDLIHMRRQLPKHLLGTHSGKPSELAAAILDEVQPGDVVSAKGCSITSDFQKVMKDLRAGRPRGVPNIKLSYTASNGASEPYNGADAAVSSASSHHEPSEPSQIVIQGRHKLDICFVGDTYFGEYYQERREKSGQINYLTKRGYSYSLKLLDTFLQRADFSVANLEVSLGNNEYSPLAGKKNRILGGDPDATIRTLQRCNIGALALGNDHTFDFGVDGLRETISAVDSRGLSPFGAGANDATADRPLKLTARLQDQSLAISVFSAFKYSSYFDEQLRAYAGPDRPGIACVSSELLDAISAIKNAKQESFVIVYPHWSEPYVWRSGEQEEMASWLTAAGADLIIGHGAHMIQEIEQKNNRWIIYGLGNFVYNSQGEYNQRCVPPYSFLARLRLTYTGHGISKAVYLYPIVSDNQVTLFRPRFLTSSEFADLLTLLQQRCPDLDPSNPAVAAGCDSHGWYISLAI